MRGLEKPAVEGWGWRRWLLGVLVACTGQVGLVFWLAGSRAAPPPVEKSQLRVRMAPAHVLQQRPRLLQKDPTLFALVNADGFSRSAWLTVEGLRYAVANPVQEMRWLSQPTEDLAADFSEFVQSSFLSDEGVGDTVTPALAQPDFPVPVVHPATALSVQGGLAGWPRVSRQPVPQASAPILTNTVVRVLVAPDGRTVSAALISSCGVASVDGEALRFAAAARYEPPGVGSSGGSESAEAVFGELTFQWARTEAEPGRCCRN